MSDWQSLQDFLARQDDRRSQMTVAKITGLYLFIAVFVTGLGMFARHQAVALTALGAN